MTVTLEEAAPTPRTVATCPAKCSGITTAKASPEALDLAFAIRDDAAGTPPDIYAWLLRMPTLRSRMQRSAVEAFPRPAAALPPAARRPS